MRAAIVAGINKFGSYGFEIGYTLFETLYNRYICTIPTHDFFRSLEMDNVVAITFLPEVTAGAMYIDF